MRPRKTMYLETEAQILALTSDVRMKIVQSLRDGEASIALIADRLMRSPNSLYHHMRRLVDAGIVRIAGSRQAGKRIERLYAVSADTYEIRHDPKSLKSRRTLSTAIRSILRLTGQDAEASVSKGLVVKAGPSRNTRVHRHDVRLTRPQMEGIFGHLDAVDEILTRADADGKGQPFSFTYLFFPSVR